MNTLISLLSVALLIAANGFFVAAEFALVGARRTRIAQLAQEGNASAKLTQKALDHLDSYIAATQLGITLMSLALGWIGEPAIAPLFEGLFHLLPLPVETIHVLTGSVSFALSFALMTVLHIVFGELAPKAIALQRPEATAMFIARPVTIFRQIFRPAIWLMNSIGNRVVRLFGVEPANGHATVLSTEELEMLVHSSREAGVLEESEEQMLRRVFDLSDVPVREIMRPRTEVDAFSLTTTLPELFKLITTFQHSRYPVYDGSIDTVVGILHSKDLLDSILSHPGLLTGAETDFKLMTILRTPLFIPESVNVDDLLARMQRTQTQFAIVIDEYGGMAGVVTMEDLIEQIVGEVRDEFDTETNAIQHRGDTSVVDGLVSLSEIAERFGEIKEEVFSTTIGGYIAERLDRIPVLGDKTTYGDYELTVEAMEGMRASQIKFVPRKTALPSVSPATLAGSKEPTSKEPASGSRGSNPTPNKPQSKSTGGNEG